MHRRLIAIGIILSGALVAAGVSTDAFGVRGSGLASYLWNLATTMTVGTIVLAVVEDVRSWGTSWRVLKTEEGPLLRNVGELMRSVAAPLGVPGIWDEPLSLADAQERLGSLSRPLSAVTYARLEHRRSQRDGGAVLLNPFESWDALSKCLRTNNTYLDPPQSADLTSEDLERAVEKLVPTLRRIAQGLSTGARGVAATAELELSDLPKLVMTAGTSLRGLRHGQPIDESHLAQAFVAIPAAIEWLVLALKLVDYEMRTGTPHPYQG